MFLDLPWAEAAAVTATDESTVDVADEVSPRSATASGMSRSPSSGTPSAAWSPDRSLTNTGATFSVS
ncbi:hypothetical protein [Curtobacterium citreum]|uniref:Uncharacterized protein n=1 Tax=Curtobacterium citreum TaxID=2036 RepID=A0ABT2HIL7_9MICO|nr:hypothetical protein [Curtobacterium citreum]MCS6523081.1 hypothetical protein [Curtobacterium citreum]